MHRHEAAREQHTYLHVRGAEGAGEMCRHMDDSWRLLQGDVRRVQGPACGRPDARPDGRPDDRRPCSAHSRGARGGAVHFVIFPACSYRRKGPHCALQRPGPLARAPPCASAGRAGHGGASR
jgi:hypothetical protein